jgi:hypothetical protein
MLKARHTKRKFYGKWLYKITVTVPGVSIFRIKNISEVMVFCVSDEPEDHYGYSTKDKAYRNRKEILAIAELFNSWEEKSWAKRIETNILDIYTNDQEKYQETIEKLGNLVVQHFEPNIDKIKDLNNPNTIVVKQFPHKRYKYKVFLCPHKIDRDARVRHQFLDWVDLQCPKILISQAVKNWFIKTHWNWDRRYLLVEDEQTLLMLKLRNSDVVGTIYNYVLADK